MITRDRIEARIFFIVLISADSFGNDHATLNEAFHNALFADYWTSWGWSSG
jgi:hypothetical protein